jgi:hypothetical protein
MVAFPGERGLLLAVGVLLVGCRPSPRMEVHPSSLELQLAGPVQSPRESGPVPATDGAANHWRHGCERVATAGGPAVRDGDAIRADDVTVPGGDWLVVTLESDGVDDVILFDGRLQTVVQATWETGRFGWLAVRSPLPKLAIAEPTCVGLTITLHGAELPDDAPSDPALLEAGATIIDPSARLFRIEQTWLLVPDTE